MNYTLRSTSQSESNGGFYKQILKIFGIDILGSEKIADDAFYTSAEMVGNLLSNNIDMQNILANKSAKIGIIGEVTKFTWPNIISAEERLTDLPDYSDLPIVFPNPERPWDDLRGVGGVPGREMTSVGEENLLNLPEDPYYGEESILLHEFSHAIHNLYLKFTPNGNAISDAYTNALTNGLWSNTYAQTNKDEYFAEITQVWFDDNPNRNSPDGTHGAVNTRIELSEYDPVAYGILDAIYRSDAWTPGKFLGTSGADNITGHNLNDVIFSMNGDDTINGGAGSDIIDAGEGTDTIVFSGNKADYTLAKAADGTYTVADSTNGRDGTDTIRNAEKFQFIDQLFDTSSANVQADNGTKDSIYDISRFYNSATGAHFYTASDAERDSLIASGGTFVYEGNVFDSNATMDTGLIVFRLYNTETGVHFYTANAKERASIAANLPQFNDEGEAYYAYAEGGAGRQALHRFYNTDNGTHFYTASDAEQQQVATTLTQYQYEGVAYYVEIA